MSRLETHSLVIDVPGRADGSALNLCLAPGQVWGVLGPNGAGKNTLLHTLAGLCDPRAGEMDLDVAHPKSLLVNTLSGGEFQRVAIATVLTQSPQLWLADVSTNHLDLHHQTAVMALLAEQAAACKVVLMRIHDLNLAARWCDHILFLYPEGEVCWGPGTDMLVPSVLERLYDQRLATAETDGAPVFVPAR